jgi:hypothetical protein
MAPGNRDFVEYQAWLSAGGEMAAPTLSDIQAAQIAALSAACASAIVSGFSSSALGTAYTYPSKTTDQINLDASVTASQIQTDPNWTTPFWCADADGNWSLMSHTAAQIQQAGLDGKAAILANITKNTNLAQQVMSAESLEDVWRVNWS